MSYYSQYKQDQILEKLFLKRVKNGVFLDVGANDGVTFSNTYYFEKYHNWNGVCFEPQPIINNILRKNRKCIISDIAIFSSKLILEFNQVIGPDMLSGLVISQSQYELEKIRHYDGKIEIIKVNADTLSSELRKHDISSSFIDFVSIDVEGAEIEILKGIEDDDYKRIGCMIVENNQRIKEIEEYLSSKMYRKMLTYKCDDYYINLVHYNKLEISFLRLKCLYFFKRLGILKKIREFINKINFLNL